jgi:hypothetical protein
MVYDGVNNLIWDQNAGGGDLADLASTATGKGAALIGYKASGASSVVQDVSAALNGLSLNFRSYGAVLDGTTDDTAAVNACIAEAAVLGAKQIILDGRAKLSSMVTIAGISGLTIIGQAEYRESSTTSAATGFVCSTASAGLTLSNTQGVNLKNVYIDDGGVATTPLVFDRVRFSTHENIYIKATNASHVAAWLFTNTTTGVPDDANDWNTFLNCGVYGAKPIVFTNSTYVAGSAYGSGGSWHNTFINTNIGCTGTGYAIDFQVCDNLTFIETYIFQHSTGKAVHWTYNAGATYAPNSIYFYHLQAGGGLSIDSGANYPGAIFGYDMSNGQPLPSIPAGCALSFTSDGINGHGWNVQDLVALGIRTARVAGGDSWIFSDPNSKGVALWNDANGNAFKYVLNYSTRNVDMFINPDGSGDSIGLSISSTGPIVPAGKRLIFADSQTTVGGAGGASALPATPVAYVRIQIGGTPYVIPAYAAS